VFIVDRYSKIGKYRSLFSGFVGFFSKGIFACLGVLSPFLLLQGLQAVTMFVQLVGEVFSGHLDLGIT
jgi:hypothetical protein